MPGFMPFMPCPSQVVGTDFEAGLNVQGKQGGKTLYMPEKMAAMELLGYTSSDVQVKVTSDEGTLSYCLEQLAHSNSAPELHKEFAKTHLPKLLPQAATKALVNSAVVSPVIHPRP